MANDKIDEMFSYIYIVNEDDLKYEIEETSKTFSTDMQEEWCILKKILFVCECNICRSPMAEFVFKNMLRGRTDIWIASAGISGERLGSPIYPQAQECLEKHGIPIEERRAVKFHFKDYFEYDYIIGMDEWNKYNLKWLCDMDPQHKIFKLLEFSDRSTLGMPRDDAIIYTNILDPHMTRDFERAYNEICEGCEGLKRFIADKTEGA